MKKTIIILLCAIFLGSFSIILLLFKINKNNDFKKEKIGTYLMNSDNESELLQKVCEKNGNWKYYPLSSKFLSKYNEKDGIFGNMQFDKVEVNPYVNTNDNMYLSHYNHIVITNKNRLTIYQYKLKTIGSFSKPPYYPLLDDIELTEPIYSTIDENGNFEYKSSMSNSHKITNIYNLCDGGVDESSVAVTDKFHKKYPFFLDLFIHYSPLSYNKIKFIEKESDLENNIAIFEVDSILECKKRKYKVKLILDDKLYLDDCEVELLEETKYKGNKNNSSAKAFYLHSDLENTTLADEFIEELKVKGSYFDDIDNIDIDYIVDEAFIKNNDTDIIRSYKMKDGTINSYYVKYNYNENKKISNIIPIKLDYTNVSAEEAAKLYIESIKE